MIFRTFCLVSLWIFLVLPISGNSLDEPPGIEQQNSNTIDKRSYNLGAIGAFAEMVAADVKKLGLSAPLSPEEMDALIDDAKKIAEKNGAKIYREEDFLVTDLFPEELTKGKHVLLIYTGSTKDDYFALKSKKQKLVETGKFSGAAREAIAHDMGKLLSYSDRKIDSLLKK
ncbi:hypothetical protein ACFLT2_04240 [Acidobacteriota bacterium]